MDGAVCKCPDAPQITMPLEPDGPCRKSVFKIQVETDSKLSYSRNTPEACAYCLKRRGSGEQLPLCTGCQSVRFCNREHQLALWPLHKAFCKDQQSRREHRALHPSESPLLDRVRRLAEDWVEIHRHSLEEARAWVLHDSNPRMDFRSHHFKFHLRFRPESGGNPSTSFSLVGAEVGAHAALEADQARCLAALLPLIEDTEAEEHANEVKGFLGIFACLYVLEGEPLWTTASFIYDCDLPSNRPDDRPWFWFPKHCAESGLVFRLVGTGDSNWKPGLMKREENTWVWKEQSLTEFSRRGISVEGIDYQ
ncbi:hypothetical protein B0H11DRAFT_485457 [Mycena galericulata]|nr:hypothetical protein B0H11DRAFT_485457 [Mycena galericulata]